MELGSAEDGVTITLTYDEARRLGISIDAGCETVTRAEYYIGTGLSELLMQQVADWRTAPRRRASSALILALDAGDEEVENSRRPAPRPPTTCCASTPGRLSAIRDQGLSVRTPACRPDRGMIGRPSTEPAMGLAAVARPLVALPAGGCRELLRSCSVNPKRPPLSG